jgi:hypothetical protein
LWGFDANTGFSSRTVVRRSDFSGPTLSIAGAVLMARVKA